MKQDEARCKADIEDNQKEIDKLLAHIASEEKKQEKQEKKQQQEQNQGNQCCDSC